MVFGRFLLFSITSGFNGLFINLNFGRIFKFSCVEELEAMLEANVLNGKVYPARRERIRNRAEKTIIPEVWAFYLWRFTSMLLGRGGNDP